MPLRKSIEELQPYAPPTGRGVPLHRNTNLWGTNPIAHDLPYWIEQIDLADYPHGSSQGLREELAKFHNLAPENFLIGNGSNEVFDLIFKTFVNPGERVAHATPSYSMYQHFALTNSVGVEEVDLDEFFGLIPETFSLTDASIFVLCSPNNPTGNSFRPDMIRQILDIGRLVVIDEAYAEFSDQNWLQETGNYDNLLVTRTFSKAFGLAALRVGYVTGHPKLISLIDRVRLPYNINAISQVIATMALRNPSFVDGYVELIRSERVRWAEALEQRGLKAYPTDANFMLAQVPANCERDTFISDLEKAGVLVRSTDHEKLRDHVRITVGTPEDLVALKRALDEVLA